MSGNARSDDELALAVRAIEQSNLAIGQALNNDPQGLVTVVAEQLVPGVPTGVPVLGNPVPAILIRCRALVASHTNTSKEWR